MNSSKIVEWKGNDQRELNQLLKECAGTGKRVAFAERLGKFALSSVRKVPLSERKTILKEAADSAVASLYEAKMSQADKMNLNARVYPTSAMQKNVDRFQPLLGEGYLTGAVDHLGENDGGNLKSTPIIWRTLKLEDDGSMIGHFQVVGAHTEGANLKAQLDDGMAVGFSTFGYGSGHEPTDEERKQYGIPEDLEDAVVMNDDYEMVKCDAVDNPSVTDARILRLPSEPGDGNTYTYATPGVPPGVGPGAAMSRGASGTAESTNAVKLNNDVANSALYAATHGHFSRDKFEPEAWERSKESWWVFLGEDTSQPATEPAHWLFPIRNGDGKLSGPGVLDAAKRSEESHPDIYAAAIAIRDAMIDWDRRDKAKPNEKPADKSNHERPRIQGLTAAEVAKKVPVSERADKTPLRRRYQQYFKSDDGYEAAGKVTLAPKLENDAYRVEMGWSGPVFTRMQPNTDDLYKFPGSILEKVLQDIDHFWDLKENYKKFGILHNHGILLEGPPGSGKTSICNQAAEMIIDRDDVVFYSDHVPTLVSGLKAFRDVEPDRQVVVVLEDGDDLLYNERALLNLMSGEDSISGVLYLATTNYVERFPARLLRPGRFDKRIFVGPPPYEGRKAYLDKKLAGSETPEEIESLAKETDGLSFAHLRELITAIYARQEPKDEVLARLKPAKSIGNTRENLPAAPVIETAHRLDQGKVEETRILQGDSVMETNKPAVVETPNKPASTNQKLAEATKPLLAHLKENCPDGLPTHEVLPTEIKAQLESLKADISSRDQKLVEKDTRIAVLETEVGDLKAEKANTQRIIAVMAKAKEAVKDNRFAPELIKDIQEAAKDSSFTADKVETLVIANAERFERIAGLGKGASKVTKAEKSKQVKKPVEQPVTDMLGTELDDDTIDALEEDAEGGEGAVKESAPLPGISEAFGGRKKVAAERAA